MAQSNHRSKKPPPWSNSKSWRINLLFFLFPWLDWVFDVQRRTWKSASLDLVSRDRGVVIFFASPVCHAHWIFQARHFTIFVACARCNHFSIAIATRAWRRGFRVATSLVTVPAGQCCIFHQQSCMSKAKRSAFSNLTSFRNSFEIYNKGIGSWAHALLVDLWISLLTPELWRFLERSKDNYYDCVE